MKCKICKVFAYCSPFLCIPCTRVCKQMLVRYTDYTSQFWFKTRRAINDKIFIYDTKRCNVIFLRNRFNPTKLIITYIFRKRVHLVISKDWNICSDYLDLYHKCSGPEQRNRYRLKGPVIESRSRRNFPVPFLDDRGNHPVPLYKGPESFLGLQRPKSGFNHSSRLTLSLKTV